MDNDKNIIDKFLEYITIERRYSNLTAISYQKDLLALCKFLSVSPDAFCPELVTEDDVKAFLISELDRGKVARSVKRTLSSMRSFWKFLLRIGCLKVDVTARIIPPKIDHPLPVFFKESEMELATAYDSMVNDFSSSLDALVIEMLYQTGMRRAELLGLADTDIDFSLKQIRVLGKRNKERIVPVADPLLDQIRQYQQYRSELPVLSERKHLLVGQDGCALSESKLYSIVKRRMSEVSSLKKQSPHVLRHTFATTMLDNGADINTIKTLMGHASLAATQIYTHTTFEQIRKEYKKAHPRANGGNTV